MDSQQKVGLEGQVAELLRMNAQWHPGETVRRDLVLDLDPARKYHKWMDKNGKYMIIQNAIKS